MSGLFVSAVIVFLLCLSFCAQISSNICGTIKKIDSDSWEETNKDRSSWPFLAALFSYESDNFICDGTLITAKSVLTAAHCVQPKNPEKMLAPEDLIILLGAYDINDMIETGRRQNNVDEIHVHPDWNTSSEQYEADLAILHLSIPVEFTHFIRPICMPDDDVPKNVMGSIVGYGQLDMRKSIPLESHAKVSNDSFCTSAQSGVALLLSQRVFCGSGEIGSSVRRDARGGFFVRFESVWIQFGIFSTVTNRASDVLKQSDTHAFYTNLWAFKNWIDETTTDTGYRVFKKNVEIDLECVFKKFLTYWCTVHKANVKNENSEVSSFSGNHDVDRDNQNVSKIILKNVEIHYLPDGIGKIFKNLKYFTAGKNLKRLRRSNFKDMESLQLLHVDNNVIMTIDEDTLRDLPNLISLDIFSNRLKVLHKNTFAKNFRLETVDANRNELEFLHKDLFKHNSLLRKVDFSYNKLKRVLIDFTRFKYFSIAYFSSNICIDDISRNLAEFQIRLKDQCSDLEVD